MAIEIERVSNPGTDRITFTATTSTGRRFAVDCTPYQVGLAEATLKRHIEDYERDLTAGHTHRPEGVTNRIGMKGKFPAGAHGTLPGAEARAIFSGKIKPPKGAK